MSPTVALSPWTSARVAGFGVAQAVALGAIVGGWFAAPGPHSSSGVWPWLAVCLGGLGPSALANGAAVFTSRPAIAGRPLPTVDLPRRRPTRAVVHDRPVSVTGMTPVH